MYLIFLLSLGVLAGIIFFSVIAYKFTTFFSSNLSNDVEEVEDLWEEGNGEGEEVWAEGEAVPPESQVGGLVECKGR